MNTLIVVLIAMLFHTPVHPKRECQLPGSLAKRIAMHSDMNHRMLGVYDL